MILYEDRDIIVCEKTAGIPVQTAKIGTPDMVSILKNYRKENEQIQGEPYLGLVHRLDQPVEGLIVFAKHKQAAAELSKQQMKKCYQALVQGILIEEDGHLIDYLLKDGKTNTSKIVKEGTKGAKRAELYYRVSARSEEATLLEIRLITGRHHQIRVQLAGMGFPLFGERKYNQAEITKQISELALCASRLSFLHPKTRQEMLFEIEPKGAIFRQFL